ncbi:hypothetical protein Dimus_020947, partial [Dionaea muscipula]
IELESNRDETGTGYHKRRSSSSPVVDKKKKKRVRKLVMSSPSVASSTSPAKEGSAEVRSSVGEAPEGEQAKDLAQDPPQGAQDPRDANIGVVGIGKEVEEAGAAGVTEEGSVEEVARAATEEPILIDSPINVDEEIQRFNGWLSWKLSRSRLQEADFARMHEEEDWVMSKVECYELFELVDAGKLFKFFKIGVAAHKRHAIKMGKRPEGEEAEKGSKDDDDDDDDNQGGHNPEIPQSQPQT